MSGERTIFTETVGSIHSYTRSRAPWKLETYNKKLFHYLSGGGISSLGRTIKQEEADIKRDKFLAYCAAIGVVLLVFWFV
ncbi:MAG: hypothetical protein IJQ34_01250 [Kiritimatiellae bacterium]|nr:hypothetical protein [Kiritimatiellia bacterium]